MYIECHPLCYNCTGRVRNECLYCANTAFQVDHSGPLSCLASCKFDIEGYYPLSTTTPKLCKRIHLLVYI